MEVCTHTRDVVSCTLLRILLYFRGQAEIWPQSQKKALDHESAVRTSEDVARSSDDRKSPRTFGVLRPLSPQKNSNARSHAHAHILLINSET